MKVRFITKPSRKIEYCCPEMEKAEKGKAILFPTIEGGLIFGPNNDPYIIRGPLPYKISFCPFCGEKIIFEEV